MNDFGIQCIIKQFDYVDKDESSQSDYESSKSEYHQKEGQYDDKSFSEGPSNCSENTPAKTAFIIYWSLLVILLKICLTCSLPATIKNITVKGAPLIIKLICPNMHENIWKSQPSVIQYSKGNKRQFSAVQVFAKIKSISRLPMFNGLQKLVIMQFSRLNREWRVQDMWRRKTCYSWA